MFTGENHHTYRFYSTARDLTGNEEAKLPMAEATTTIELVPTAANVSVSGRVSTADGLGIAKVFLTLTDSSGNIRSARTNAFGYYVFHEVEAGQSYVITVASKRYRFAEPSRVIMVTDTLTDENFTALVSTSLLQRGDSS